MEVRGIWGHVLTEKSSLIVNDPEAVPFGVGLPSGHPPLTSFLGVPLVRGGKTFGMIALANKEDGYDKFDQEQIEALAVPFVEALTRKQINIELENHKENLENLVAERSEKLIEVNKQLQESNERFKALQDASFGGVAIHAMGSILDCNQALSEITGFSRTELINMDGFKLIAPASLALVLRNVKSGYEQSYEVEGVRKDGSVYPLALRGKNIFLGGRQVRVMEFRDITERKQTEEERERLLQAIDQSIEAIVITNDKGTIQYTNPAFEKITGYACEEAIGENPRILKSDEHNEAFYKEMWETLTCGKTWAGQFINKKKDGTFYTEEVTISPVRDTSGKTVNYVAVKRDITNEIRAEEQRQELEAQLRQKFKMEAVGLMAGGMAHNFNNNLAIILGNIELLLLKHPGEDRIRTRLTDIKIAAIRSRDLIQSILTYSRQGSHDKLPVQLTLMISETLKLLQGTIPATVKMEQKIHPDNQGITINADSSQIQEILVNLCNNAIHAMQEQGTLTIALDTTELQAQDIPPQYDGLPGVYAKLSVQDTGSGMTEETMAKIFDPFFTTKDVDEGTGMGLATVQGIMNHHHGLIKVSSTPGHGSTFDLYFPLLKEQQQTVLPTTVDLTGGSERILIVDDEERLVTASSQMLMEYGYEVTAMTSSVEALQLFKANPADFDLVITDQTMPNLSGEALLREILRISPELPTILCTGFSNIIDNEKAGKMGIKAFLMKPFDMSKLILTTRQILDGKQTG
ncbi:MAG: PAS domain S-box protein [Desulfuromonadales bacterium]|nr:PAS domain S-box protein [Desulfuromonadales bacterium]